MNVRQKALKILQEFRSQLDELDMSRQEYTKLQSYSRKVFEKMGALELEVEPVETTGGINHCNRCATPTGMSNPPSYVCWNTCPCHQPKDAPTKNWGGGIFNAPKLPEKLRQKNELCRCGTFPEVQNHIEELETDTNFLASKINEIIDYLEKHG